MAVYKDNRAFSLKLYIVIFFLFAHNISIAQNHPNVMGYELEYRLVYVNLNLLTHYELANEVLEQAAANCYNGVVLADGKILNLSIHGDFYLNKLNEFLNLADALGLTVYPSSSPQYSVLQYNPHLAEGLPVNDAPFIVDQNGILVNNPNDNFPFTTENFDTPTTVNPNWGYSDDVSIENGNAVFDIQYSTESVTSQIYRYLDVQPFRNYHVSFSLKVEEQDLSKFEELTWAFRIQGNELDYRNLYYGKLKSEIAANNQNGIDWYDYNFTFNTLEAENIIMDFRTISKETNSKIYLDNVTVQPTGLNNIIRRDGTPVSIKNVTKNVYLTEGNEIGALLDPLLVDQWVGDYHDWHPQPVIQTNLSHPNISVGDEIEISYYHAGLIREGAYASLTHPEVFDITQNQFTTLRSLWAEENRNIFDGWFFGHDEIRVHGWDLNPQGSPGANLAYHFDMLYNQIPANEKIIIWNDMFDPFANAYEYQDGSGDYDWWTPEYYLVKDRWTNSHVNFPSDVIVLNWNRDDRNISTDENNIKLPRIESAKFFDGRGNTQILGGYYDQDLNIISDRISELNINGVEDIAGVMYCTWIGDFSRLDEWAQEIWGGSNWCEPNQNCTDINLNYSGTIPNENVQVQNEITTSGTTTINSGSTINLNAGNKIRLNAGFKIIEGNNNIKMEVKSCEGQ